MNHPAFPRVFSGPLPSQKYRPFRLHWRRSQEDLANLLFLQRLDIREDLCGGIEGHLSCISTTTGTPLHAFLGQPVTIQMVTDRKALHSICAIVTDAQEGESDGSLATYRLTVRDALSIMEQRINTRIFRSKSVVDIIRTLVQEWRHKSLTLGGTFDLDISNLDASKSPVREQTLQFDESDADFIRRLCRREGIAWFIRAGGGRNETDLAQQPFHTLVLFDDAVNLRRSATDSVPYHPDAATGKRDAITLLAMNRRLVPGSIRRASWDFKLGRVDEVCAPTRVDQERAGNDLAALLSDARIDSPHLADTARDYERFAIARLLAPGARATGVSGASGVRDLKVGSWVQVSGHPELDPLPEPQRRIVITSLHHIGENNLPKDLNARAQSLFEANRWPMGRAPVSVDTSARPTTVDGSSPCRYENTFGGVPLGTPLVPAYDPRIDLPRVYPVTGTIVAPEGEQVHTDEYGRYKVRIQGLAPVDHEHANGAGTSGTPSDSAWVRALSNWAGNDFGHQTPLRTGMEVLLDFAGGDPDKMFIAGVFSNWDNMPATFSGKGALPGNRYLSGMRSREINGRRYNQLRLDDTPSQISAQLSSQHAASEINLGYLTQPRENGQGAKRGEGAELRTDAAAALRAAQGMLLTTYARSQAGGNQLDREELVQLLAECTELFKALGDYAGQHGGKAMDTAGQGAVTSAFKGWEDSGGEPLIALGAQAGSVNVTPKTHVIYAGKNIDQVAQQNVQVASGQRINLQAGHGVELFTQADDISAVANQGKVKLQSQGDDTQIDSAKNVQFTATDGTLTGAAADQVVLVTSGGAYLKLRGGDIELGCPGSFTVKAARHTWDGPASMSTDMPQFDHAPLGRVPKFVRATDAQAANGCDAELRKISGDLLNQKADGAGELPPVSGSQFEQFAVQIIKKKV